jgi:cytochrome P450
MTTTTAPDTHLLPAEIARSVVSAKAHAMPQRLHDAYTWARQNNPLGRAQVEGFDPFWLVTKHADVAAIGRDSETFRNGDRPVILAPNAGIEMVKAMTGGRHQLVLSLVHLDNPEHKALRNITQSWFMPNSVSKLDARMRLLAKATVDKMVAASGQVSDFVHDVALHYPLHVIMDILGVPPEDEPRMLQLTQEFFAPEDPELARTKAPMSAAERAKVVHGIVADFERYFAQITAQRRVQPRNDVASLLANAMINGQPISDEHRLGYYIIIATAGHDTTSASISTAMWALGQFPELLPRLKAEPTLINGLIEEAMRWATPVRHFMRTATVDAQVRGRLIRQGDWLMLCYASANRDEEVFDAPFEFRIDRRPVRHLAFGHGPHVCLGQYLARLEMRLLFEELLPRLTSVELVGEMALSMSNFVTGPKRLPIRYQVAQAV